MDIYPNVTVIIPTYNRARTISRSIESVLNQTYRNIHVVVVDDGSRDNTIEILNRYMCDDRIELAIHPVNKGVCAALNTGFGFIKGDWFTLIGSDDEMVPDALEKMIRILNTVDDSITAITCNCIDTTTGEFSGKGLSESGYITAIDIMQKCSGEHWGITKTELLGDDRLDERVNGGEGVLWHKISRRAKRYYLHEALRIYHTEGDDRICARRPIDLKREIEKHAILSHEEPDYVEDLRMYSKKDYHRHIMYYGMHCSLAGNRKQARKALMELVRNRCMKGSIALVLVAVIGVQNMQYVLNKIVYRRCKVTNMVYYTSTNKL